MLKINKIILSTLILLSVFLFLAIIIINVEAKEIDIYKPIITDDSSLSATVFATDNITTMDTKFIDGRLHVSDSVHGVKNLRVLESMLVNRLKGYNGKEVMFYHVNDAGVKDSSRLVPIKSDGAWTYFYDVEFSEVIIDGFVGTWEVTAYNLSASDSLNFGQTFNASNVTSLSVNVTDDAIKSHPYDINTTGLVGWWKLDDNYLDSSGNGNDGTGYGADIRFDHGKYNNGTVLNGVDDYVDCGNDMSLETEYAISILAHINVSTVPTYYKRIVAKSYDWDLWLRSGPTLQFNIRTNNIESGRIGINPWGTADDINKLHLIGVTFDYNKSINHDGWTTKTSMPENVADATAVVYNDELYAFGGYGDGGSADPLNTTLKYNVSDDSWTYKTNMPTARWGLVASRVDDTAYVFGGNNGGSISTSEAYNITNDSWSSITNLPGNLVQQGLMAGTYNSRIYLFKNYYAYLYDTVNDTYTQKTNPPGSVGTWGTTAVVGNYIYVMSGAAACDGHMYKYDIMGDSWTTLSDAPDGLYGVTRESPVINNKIYITHGQDEAGTFFNTVQVYDIATDTWEIKSNAIWPRDGVACGVINNKLYVVGGRIASKRLNYVEVLNPLNLSDTVDFNLFLYIDDNVVKETCYNYPMTHNNKNITIGGSGFIFNGTIDNVLIYNREVSETEYKQYYCDHLQQFQIKTSTNATWSTEWNSTADNPIKVPYGAGELFNLLNFTVPESIIKNGITIYDYPSTVQFDALAIVGYTEEATKITEEATAGTYILNVTHAANNTGEGYINYMTANAVLLNADFWNTAVLTTDNPNASLSSTLPHFNISTGYVAATTEFYYLVEQDYFYPPTNIQTTPSRCCVNITWDAVPNADNYSVYELEDGFPYVTTNPTVDGVKDTIYDYAHEFLIFSPNFITHGDYGTIYPLRTSLGAYLLIESIDNDDKLGDDDIIYYFDLDNNGLTINDPAWKITNNIVKKYLWNGNTWAVTGSTNAVGDSTGGGTHYPIHELFIPVAELGSNWTNGSIVKVLVKHEDSALNPDVVTWYPYGNINNTDTNLWQEMVLNNPESYIFLNNITNLWYNATELTPFTIYHGAITAWNGSQETDYGLFDVITEDIPYFNVSGYILDVDNNLLSNAIVYSCNGFVHEITTTNESGYYIGYNFREGNYTICGNKNGYIQNSIDIYVTTNLTNQNITLFYVSNADLFNKMLEIESQNNEILLNMSVNNTIVNDKIDTILIFILLNMAVIVGVIIGKRGKDNDN